MAVYLGMLRVVRLCAGRPEVLGARGGLSRVWQEARLWGVRPLSSGEVDHTAPLPIGGLSYIQGNTKLRLINKTVGWCLDATAQKIPDKEALVVFHENIRLTFAQLKEQVDKAAAGLLSIGLRKGDRLGMWGPNSYAWVLIQLATAQAGIILVSVNPAYQAPELEYALKKVGCKALVFPKQFKTQQYYNILKQICPEVEKAKPGALKSQRLPDLTIVISVDTPLPGTLFLDDVVAAGNQEQHLAQLRHTQKFLSCHDPINIQFTSGTTGSPKGATLSHYNIVNNSNMIGERLQLSQKTAEKSRMVLPTPLYHCLGSVGGTMVSLMHGVTLILSSPVFDGKKALEAISRERGSFLYGTPTMFVDILNQPDFSSYDISAICGGVIAGSPVPPELIRAIINKMNMKELVVAYGTTENSPVTFMNFPEDTMEQKAESVGRVMPHTEAQIMNMETRTLAELNTPGELCIRGYCVMQGYWGDPQKTDEVIGQDKWYRTGDIAVMDEQGFCRIVGRAKDMIIRGGENIYPAELEDFFHTHPQVQDVQVRHPALRSSGETPRGRGHGWGCGWGCLPLSLTLEGGGSEGQPDGGGNLCLHSAQEGGEDHGGGDQGFLQREGGGLIPAFPPPPPRPL
uniref:Medium-chain acyl-CoA ligase ACSF2, mitochondrial n=1 Tax=Sus scrofa TaxID=9823 RepID=A0A480N5L4_PIG